MKKKTISKLLAPSMTTTLKMLSASLLFLAAGTVNAQQDLSTGVAVMANGLDSNGNPVKLYDTGNDRKFFDNVTYYSLVDPGSGMPGANGIIADPKGSGYAAMQRNTRTVELAYSSYASNSNYNGVVDWGITRDANWSAAYTVTGAAPTTWGGTAAVAGIEGFLKNAFGRNEIGFIDSYITKGYSGRTVYGTTAEIYGSPTVNTNGIAYQAGLKYIDTGKGVIGSSAGLYYDEAGQYHMDASGHITYDGNLSGKSSAVEYDDWNQHGIVLTGADLIAYTVGFTTNGADTVIEGAFNVLGNFRDVYINGNKIDQSLLNLTENLYGDVILNGNGAGKGIVGEYTMCLDLSDIDPSWWNATGTNNISFLVESVTPNMLGLSANSNSYAITAGFNYFSADIQYGSRIPMLVPEPGTYIMLLAGLGMVGMVTRRRIKAGRN